MGGEFLHPITWTLTETQLLDTSETETLPENMQNYLTLATASRTPDSSVPTRVPPKTNREPASKPLPRRRYGFSLQNYPFRATRVGLNTKLEIETTTTPSEAERVNEEPHPDIARKGYKSVAPVKFSDVTSIGSDLDEKPNEIDDTSPQRTGQDVQSPLVMTSPFSYFTATTASSDKESYGNLSVSGVPVVGLTSQSLPLLASEKKNTGIERSPGTFKGIARDMDLATLSTPSHPLQVMVNGTMMNWRQAVALRKGEYFDMEKFWREGMTTKRKRKFRNVS